MRLIRLFVVFVLFALAVGSAEASTLVVDQENAGQSHGSIGFAMRDLAQSFVPAFDWLEVVELGLRCCASGTSSLIRVDIRDGGVAGPVVGASAAVNLLDGTDANPFTRFTFSPPLALTPGALYVIDLVHISGAEGVWLRTPDTDYPPGTMYADGAGGGSFDAWFRTGILSQVPPQELLTDRVPVEYSNELDEKASVGGGHDGLDPGQLLYTEPPDGAADGRPRDAADFFPAIEDGSDPAAQVDAVAGGFDALFRQVVGNEVHLLVSVVGDGVGSDLAALLETPDGETAAHYWHDDLNAGGLTTELDDLDGLELWGPIDADDATYYSLLNDVIHGASIFIDFGGSSSPYISQSEIASVVATLGYTGAAREVDVDALMVQNAGLVEAFDYGDAILFSIRDVPGSGFDGGEIVHMPFGGTPHFLDHGGHEWDPSFAVADHFGTDLIATEDVDAIEATPLAPAEPAPALPGWGIALVVLGVGALGWRVVRGRARFGL